LKVPETDPAFLALHTSHRRGIHFMYGCWYSAF